ncbi:DUF4397 domain-containing protein [Litorilinea aerophila]|nr:DUF4397 domain-containing protein [Litorilinea aerophila]MCC9077263.1 DUF4397 domain-containing protein [Litorilinea aerophila]GIV79492.1 MAG: hypothetical protein KatS3mg050_3886 [Litorilinea sp.]
MQAIEGDQDHRQQPRRRPRPGYALVFVLLLLLAGHAWLTGQAWAQTGSSSTDGTLPPPGDTIVPVSAQVRLAHMAPFASNTLLNVTLSGSNSIYQFLNLELGDFTSGYVGLSPGTVTVQVIPQVVPSFTVTETLALPTSYTGAIVGGSNGWPLEMLWLVDETGTPPAGLGKIRVVHVAPFANTSAGTRLHVRTQGGQVIDPSLENLEYRDESGFLTLPVGSYDWRVLQAGDNSTWLDLPPFNLLPGAVLTLWLMGDGINQPPVSRLLVSQGGGGTLLYFPIIFGNSS